MVDKIPRRKGHSCEKGAESELLAASDLLRRGWFVFRSVSHSSPCDLVILKHGGIFRVEVKSGSPVYAGKISIKKQDDIEPAYDILAVVWDGHVTYHPNIDALDGW